MHNIVISTCFLVIFAFKMSQSLKWLVIEYSLVYNFAVHLKKQTAGPGQLGPSQLGPGLFGPRQLGAGHLGPWTIGPQSAGPRTVGTQTAGPRTVGPWTGVGAQLSVFQGRQLGFSHKNQDRIKNVELYTHFRNALPPQGPTGPKDNNKS